MRNELRRAPRLAVVAAAAMLAAFAVAGYSFYNARSQSCRRSDRTLNVLADIIRRARPTPADLRAMRADERARVAAFYRFTDARLAAARC